MKSNMWKCYYQKAEVTSKLKAYSFVFWGKKCTRKKHPNSEVIYAFRNQIYYFYVAELNMKVWVFSLWKRVAEGPNPKHNHGFILHTAIIHHIILPHEQYRLKRKKTRQNSSRECIKYHWASNESAWSQVGWAKGATVM